MEEKNLSEILASDVVVPEIQREYVWGNNERVLANFITDINSKFTLIDGKSFSYENGRTINKFVLDIKSEAELNVGFLYSYKPYQDQNEIFLIDGQQRITTLILIAFYCAIKENRLGDFKKLIRINETNPAFSYRVRSCTKDFMTKLFASVDNLDDLKKIKNQKWYLDRYNSDITILSMIKAVEIIYKNLKDTTKLYDYIVENVRFWYFNVGETSQGEELYITMNSRGESLTNSEQIKPLLFEKELDKDIKQRFGKLWDNIEEYFFSIKSSEKGVEIVDTMMNRFIQLILQIENQTEKRIDGTTRFTNEEIQKIDFEKINRYFEALKIIDSNFKEESKTSLLSCLSEEKQEEKLLFPLAALMKAVYIINNSTNLDESQHREMLRLYHIVRNSVRRGTIKYVPLLKFMALYDGSKDIYSLITVGNYNAERKENLLSPHEFEKIIIITNSYSIENTEQAFWNAQESLEYLLSGSLKPLIAPFKDAKWTNEILAAFEKRKQIATEVFSLSNIEKKLSIEHKVGEIDNAIISRALLTFGDYTKTYSGSNKCFGWHDKWQDIFKKPKGYEILTLFISKLSELPESKPIYEKLNMIINDFIENFDKNNKDTRYYLIKYQNAFRAINDGQNFMCFWGGWNNYKIEVLNWSSLNSYHINPFLMAVIYGLKTPDRSCLKCTNNDRFSYIKINERINIECSSKHEWIVKSDDRLELGNLVDEKVIDETKNNGKKIQYSYSVDLNDDLIEKGIELFNKLQDFK